MHTPDFSKIKWWTVLRKKTLPPIYYLGVLGYLHRRAALGETFIRFEMLTQKDAPESVRGAGKKFECRYAQFMPRLCPADFRRSPVEVVCIDRRDHNTLPTW